MRNGFASDKGTDDFFVPPYPILLGVRRKNQNLRKIEMKIGYKLGICLAGTSLLSAALGIGSLLSITDISNEMDAAVHVTEKKAALASDLKYAMLTMRHSERGIELFASVHGTEKVAANVKALDLAESKVAADRLELGPLMHTGQEQQLLDAARAAVKTWEDGQVVVYNLISQDRFAEAIQLDMSTLVAPGTAATNAMSDLRNLQQGFFEESALRAAAVTRNCRMLIGLLFALSIVLGIVAAMVLRSSTRHLIEIASEISIGAEQVSAAALQVAAASQSLAQGASEQAATIEETSSASLEISSMAKRTSENSHETAAMVADSQQGFLQADRSLTEMVAAMNSINNSSHKISKIIKVIDEIAFQTNILALNAAVEAARAGESGKGFAVVADEVRNLSQRCAQAACDTAELIEESIAHASAGRIKMDDVAAAIGSITSVSSKVKVLVDEINLGSLEQTRGIEQISQAILQMEQVTQTNAAGAEQGAAAAAELDLQADAMKQAVARLRLMVEGEGVYLPGSEVRICSARPQTA
jgi:methyl-accepting chemotaxis protein/methyl-accepting chemotaxis protein-1 (serine sensor receptor)